MKDRFKWVVKSMIMIAIISIPVLANPEKIKPLDTHNSMTVFISLMFTYGLLLWRIYKDEYIIKQQGRFFEDGLTKGIRLLLLFIAFVNYYQWSFTSDLSSVKSNLMSALIFMALYLYLLFHRVLMDADCLYVGLNVIRFDEIRNIEELAPRRSYFSTIKVTDKEKSIKITRKSEVIEDIIGILIQQSHI